MLTAHVVRVRGVDGFEALVRLPLRISVERPVRIRRRAPVTALPGSGNANHCLVILIGGKDVLLANYQEEGGVLVADAYLTAPTSTFPQVEVPGVPGAFVDVDAAMAWAASQGYDPKIMRGALK